MESTQPTEAASESKITPEERVAARTIPWDLIIRDLQDGFSMPEVARRYHVLYDTVKKYVKRHKIALPTAGLQTRIEQNLHKVVETAVEKVIDKWAAKGEKHREVAFDVAHDSVKKFKAKAPKNFRELEAADKIARRAAGLETADVIQQTLINVNEAIENFEEPREVEVVETPQLPAPTEAVPQ